jgi:hypothetical protein
MCDPFTIETTCELYHDLFVTLVTISLKRMMRYKRMMLQFSKKPWLICKTDLSFTPKIHSAIAYAIEQVKRLGGIGDVLEDDLEHHIFIKYPQKLRHMSASRRRKTSRLS